MPHEYHIQNAPCERTRTATLRCIYRREGEQEVDEEEGGGGGGSSLQAVRRKRKRQQLKKTKRNYLSLAMN